MITLPPMPARIARLRRDDRGYPIPWFVAWVREGRPVPEGIGKPDFRVIKPGGIVSAWTRQICWICGGPLGVHRVFAIGPMCVVNRVTSEPCCHRECAEFATRACPFMINPREKRNTKNMPEDGTVAGISIDRNPGVTALYETRKVHPFRAGAGYLFRLGEPERIDWWALGRTATAEEVHQSISTGMPLLVAEAKREGPDALRELQIMFNAAMPLLPKREAALQ